MELCLRGSRGGLESAEVELSRGPSPRTSERQPGRREDGPDGKRQRGAGAPEDRKRLR